MEGLVQKCEEYAAPDGSRVLVVRVGADFFVARGDRYASPLSFKVSAPFESSLEASRAARTLVNSEWRAECEQTL